MDGENRVMGTKAFGVGDKMLPIMEDLHVGVADLARDFGIFESVEPGVLAESVLGQGIRDNGVYE